MDIHFNIYELTYVKYVYELDIHFHVYELTIHLSIVQNEKVCMNGGSNLSGYLAFVFALLVIVVFVSLFLFVVVMCFVRLNK